MICARYKGMPQLQGDGNSPNTVDPKLEQSIRSAKAGGNKLDTGLRTQMEQAMGADFSQVQIHTDAQSAALNQTLQAKAFTSGKDIFFGKGAYQPGSRSGQELIAHELTHVMQQNGDSLQKKVDQSPYMATQSQLPGQIAQASLSGNGFDHSSKDVPTIQRYPLKFYRINEGGELEPDVIDSRDLFIIWSFSTENFPYFDLTKYDGVQ